MRKRVVSPGRTEAVADRGRPSAFAYGAALTALAALSITAHGLPLLGLYAVLIIASGFTDVRLRGNTPLRWVIRVLLILTLYMLTPDRDNTGSDSIGSTHARDLAGEVFASEMMLQFWRRRPSDPHLSSLIILLTSALTFLSASNTYDGAYIAVITPVYLLCIGSMAREYRGRRPQGTMLSASGRPRAFLPSLLLLVALIAAVALGSVGYHLTVANRALLTDISNRLLSKDAWEVDLGGMSAQPQLGSLFGLRGSAARVLRIENFTGDDHLCGFSYTDYDRARWGPPATILRWKAADDRLLMTPRGGRVGGTETAMRIVRITTDNPVLFMPLSATTLTVSDGVQVAHVAETGGPFRLPAGLGGSYTETIPPNDDYQGLFADPLSDENRAACLKLPDEDEMAGVRRLGQQIAGRPIEPRRKIALVVSYLIAHHKYSLEFHPAQGYYDPAASFLLSSPAAAGHCEFFATSACLLLRAVGIPTRYVTGYYVHESADNGAMVVRQRDAHAWCQAWIEGTGWVTVEATPGDGLPDALAEDTPVEPWRRVWEHVQDALQAISASLTNITPLQTGAAVVGVCAFAGAGWVYWLYRVRGRKRPGDAPYSRPAYTVPDARLLPLAVRFEAAWARAAGVPLPDNRSYTEYLHDRALNPTDGFTPWPPGLAAASDAFARAYEAARFGSPVEDDHYQSLIRFVETIEAIDPLPDGGTKPTIESIQS